MSQKGGLRIGVASLNRKQLEVKKGKEYAEVVFIGDVHYGSNNCDYERFKSQIDYCLKNNIYVFLMGDLLESATRYSVGSGVYHQLNPQQQYDEMLEILKPLAVKGLILSFVSGNHELRIMKETGIDVRKNMTREQEMIEFIICYKCKRIISCIESNGYNWTCYECKSCPLIHKNCKYYDVKKSKQSIDICNNCLREGV